MLAPSLAGFLRARRDACNASFRLARRRWTRLDPEDFSCFLVDQVSPLAAALDELPSGQSVAVLDQTYELGLQLVGEKLAGSAARHPTINALWTEVFPRLAPVIATAPRRVMAGLCNAGHHLDSTPGTDSDQWCERLAEFGPRCASADELLPVVSLLSWRAGLAHFRESALRAADRLPENLALEILGAPEASEWTDVRERHLSDPWFGFEAGALLAPGDLIRRVGGFRGYGGRFATPPRVTLSGSRLFVRSGDEAWVLMADAFGTTFHRAAPEEIAAAIPVSAAEGHFNSLPAGHLLTSSATVGTTFAATSAQSHSIWIGPQTSAP